MERLYVVVRADLELGDQFAQSNHATSSFARAHPALHAEWFDRAKNLVVLAIPSELALGELRARADANGVPWAEFHEPDLGHQLTACAFGEGVSKLVSQLPLVGRAPRCGSCRVAVAPLYLCQRCA